MNKTSNPTLNSKVLDIYHGMDTPNYLEPEIRVAPAFEGASVLGTGAVFGNKYSTEEMRQAFHNQRELQGDTTYDKAFVDRLFSKLHFDSHSVYHSKENLFRRMSRSEYIKYRREGLTDLAERACRKALEDWGGNPKDITHLYFGTMTGAMDSPTIDQALVKRLGLNLDVRRTNIEGMGCYTGFRLLNLAEEAAFGRPKTRILVIEAELRSLIGNSLPDEMTRSDIVSAALFRDAASASVVGSAPRRNETVAYNILGGTSRIVENTEHLVKYYEEDGGVIRLHLSRDLPDAIEKVEADFVNSLLNDAKEKYSKITIPSLDQFDIACHTGGPRILQKVGRGLGIDDKEHMKASWAIMKANGNLSGASNMAVLDKQNKLGGRNWVVCLSMGPGISLEGLVLRRPEISLKRQNSKTAVAA